MRRAIPAALLVLFLVAASALAASGPDLRIVSAPSVSLRDAPGIASRLLARLALGTIVTEIARTGGVDTVGGMTAPWLEVSTPSGEEGWLFGALTLPFSEAEKDALALEIAADRLGRSGDSFEAVEELHAFLSRAAVAAATPDARARLELATFGALDRAGEAVGFRRRGDPRVVAWSEANARDLVWNEPAARWTVVADRFWELHDRSASLPGADEIAWAGARAQLPGECEGDVPCSVAMLSRTDVRYLERHPRGAHAGEAISNVAVALDAAVEDPRGEALFRGSPPEEVDRMRRDLARLAELLERIDDPRARAARSSAKALLARAKAAGGRK